MPTRQQRRSAGTGVLEPPTPLRILIVSPSRLDDRLGRTVLWRSDLERSLAPDIHSGFQMAQDLRPSLVVVNAEELPDAVKLIRRLRRDDATRATAVAAIAGRSKALGASRAGANLVLPTGLEAAVYDRQLEELLEVTPRRETRLPASFQLWCRSEASGPLREAIVLNISVRGMLIETKEPLPAGVTVEIRLPLPNEPEPLPLMALVERVVSEAAGRYRSGVQFLMLRDHVRDRIRAFIDSAAV